METMVLIMPRNGTQGFLDRNSHFIKLPKVPKHAGCHRKATLLLKLVRKDGAGCDDAEPQVHPSALASGQDLI